MNICDYLSEKDKKKFVIIIIVDPICFQDSQD